MLFDKDARAYSYRVDVSLDGWTFKRLFDHTKAYYRSWQNLYFQSRLIRFIKLVGIGAYDIKEWRRDAHGFKTFDVVGMKAMYRTTNIPKLIHGIIKPSKNVATVECGAAVTDGLGGNNMLNVYLRDFTYHEIDSHIIVRFNQGYVIDSLRMLLNRLSEYSFCIETSRNGSDWEMAVDKREEALTGWQEFDFVPRAANYIKITGTKKDVVSFTLLQITPI